MNLTKNTGDTFEKFLYVINYGTGALIVSKAQNVQSKRGGRDTRYGSENL